MKILSPDVGLPVAHLTPVPRLKDYRALPKAVSD
jgi:hypothetical protein